MITVTAKKHVDQFLLDLNTFRILAEVKTDIAESDIIDILWALECVTCSSPLIHSGNTREFVFLHYADKYNPLIEVGTLTKDTCAIKIKVCIKTRTMKEVEDIVLVNDIVDRSLVVKEVVEIYLQESDTLTLEYE